MPLSFTALTQRLLFFFLLVAMLVLARPLLVPLAIAGVIAPLFVPMCRALEHRKVPPFWAVSLSLLLLFAGLAALGGLLGWQFAAISGDLAGIEQKALELLHTGQTFLLQYLGITFEEQGTLLKEQQPAMAGLLSGLAGSLATLMTNALLVLVYLFLMLYYRRHLRDFLVQLGPKDQHPALRDLIARTAGVSQHYLTGLLRMIACLWVMYGLAFSVLGLQHALFFAFLCGVLEIVPYVGNLTGSLLALIAALAQGAGWPVLGGIVLAYFAIQLIQGWVLEPLIVGKHVSINPMATILALVIGEMVWGLTGVFLAIPVTAMLKIVFDEVEPLKPLGFLLGPPAAKDPQPGIRHRLQTWWAKRGK